MACQRCKSELLAHIDACCENLCFTDVYSEGIEIDGFAPCIPWVTGRTETAIEFEVCLKCGQLQGRFPIARQYMRALKKQNKEQGALTG